VERLNADRTLRSCVEQRTNNHALAETMFLGVRAGGGPGVNTPFRWGYGWPYGRGYKALNAEEFEAARTKEDEYRAKNPALECKSDAAAAELRANPSLNPRLATAGVVSPVRASRGIIAYRAYATCLRSRG